MTAHVGGIKSVIVIKEMGRDEGENFSREAIDGGKRVPPSADDRQRG